MPSWWFVDLLHFTHLILLFPFFAFGLLAEVIFLAILLPVKSPVASVVINSFKCSLCSIHSCFCCSTHYFLPYLLPSFLQHSLQTIKNHIHQCVFYILVQLNISIEYSYCHLFTQSSASYSHCLIFQEVGNFDQ